MTREAGVNKNEGNPSKNPALQSIINHLFYQNKIQNQLRFMNHLNFSHNWGCDQGCKQSIKRKPRLAIDFKLGMAIFGYFLNSVVSTLSAWVKHKKLLLASK